MKQKKENRIALLLQWAGEQKIWLLLAILLAMASGLCIIVPYIGIYRLMDAAFQHICTKELVVQTVMMISVSVALRFVLFGCSGVAAHKGAYGALFKVRCMVAEHLAKVPLGTLNERRTGDIKTVLNEDIEKLELFLAHNLPDLVCYLVGPVVIFIYLMTVNVPLALISLVPLVLAVVVMGIMFRNTDDLMERANQSITALNSVMIEYISGMKLRDQSIHQPCDRCFSAPAAATEQDTFSVRNFQIDVMQPAMFLSCIGKRYIFKLNQPITPPRTHNSKIR